MAQPPYRQLIEIPEDYSSDEDPAPPANTANSAREGLGGRPPLSPPPNGQAHHHHKVQKNPPPVPPKKHRGLQQHGDDSRSPKRDLGTLTSAQSRAQSGPGYHHNDAFIPDGGSRHGPPHEGFHEESSGNVNITSSYALRDKSGSGPRAFSYLPNSPPVFPRARRPGATLAHPGEEPPQAFSYLPNAAAPARLSRVNESETSPHSSEETSGTNGTPPDDAVLVSTSYQITAQAGPLPASRTASQVSAALVSSTYRDVSQTQVPSASHEESGIDPLDGVDYKGEDLAGLEYLDNDVLLEHLRRRFEDRQPYTYIGESLVAVNPCMPLNIYTKQLHERYRNLRVRSRAPAHVFWVASQVRRNLLLTGRSQCVVVGGDSGAGKTESIKYILNHLVQNAAATATAAGETTSGSGGGGGGGRGGGGRDGDGGEAPRSRHRRQDLVGKLEKVNPLLELFGNASTVLNENSSRFGKLVELEYDEQGTLNTAHLECFILEKFRVTSRNPVEKNFHVFYSLFAGLSSQRLSELGLDLSAESYRILKPWDLTDGVFRTEDEMQRYRSHCALLHTVLPDVGFSSDEVSSLFKMLSAILLLSNVEFEHPDPDVDDVIILDCMGEMCLERAVRVLGLEEDEAMDFENSLLRVSMEIKGEKMVRHKTLRQARDGRDALARELYAVLFYGVIDKINHNLRDGASPVTSSSKCASIRLLDISGFENVEQHGVGGGSGGSNGFEQFIINATNERLQQFFLQRTFRHELEDYVREGVSPLDVTFTDNVEIVQLIFAKPEGLIPLLEDEIAINGNDKGWLTKCSHRTQPSPRFSPQPGATTFFIQHYAGKVKYLAEGFVTKNSDTVHHNLREVVQRSDNTFIQDYFVAGSDAAATLHRTGRASLRRRQGTSRHHVPFADKDGGRTRRTGKLTGRFTDQYQKSLSGMMSKLQTDTVFVRCIKPNLHLQSSEFQEDVVRDQLLSSGLLEVTRMRRDGFPIRTKFQDFVTRYKDLLDIGDVNRLRAEEEIRQTCDVILSSAGVSGHQMGHSKVFLKMHHRDLLDAAVDAKLRERERRAREERERQERERQEREIQERERLEGERARRERKKRAEEEGRSVGAGKEGDDSSNLTQTSLTPSSTTTSDESGFQSDRNSRIKTNSTGTKTDRLSDLTDDSNKEPGSDDATKGDVDKDDEVKPEKPETKKTGGLGNDPAYNIFRLTEKDFEHSYIGIIFVLRVATIQTQSQNNKFITNSVSMSEVRRAYNIFRVTERDFEHSTELEMKVRRGVRLLLYLLIPSLILAGGIVSRTALLWLSSTDLKEDEASDVKGMLEKLRGDRPSLAEFQRDVGPTRLLLCHVLPLLVGWLACVGQVVFGKHDWPSFKALMLLLLLDCSGVVGRSAFLYKVLPHTDFLTALVLGTCVCQVPAVLGLFSHLLVGSSTPSPGTPSLGSRRWTPRAHHYAYLALLALAGLVQLGTVPLIVFSQDVISAMSEASASKVRLPELWALVVATVCSSVGWWGNYAYGKLRSQHHKHGGSGSGSGSERLAKVKEGLYQLRIELERVRITSFVYTGPVQMVLLLTLFFVFNDSSDRDVDLLTQIDVLFRSLAEGLTDSEELENHFTVYGLVYMHLFSTLLTPYLSGLACRLYMQRAAFAAPILLVAPACLALSFACTPRDLAHWYDVDNHCVTADVREAEVTYVLVLGALVCLSVLVINQHVWFPEVERTAKIERLFFFPHRDPIFLDVNLQCTRRQDKRQNAERNRQHKKVDGKFKEGVEHPTVYICATMWHEVRQEMLQLLKSLFRVDFDIYTRRKAMSQFQISEEYSDLYDPEIHIIFDDAFDTDSKSKQRVLNSWVHQFVEVMPEAIGSVAKRNIDLQPPTKIPTPYGGRLKWTLPGGTLMYVHLKDKNLIRHRKRWSQVLYLYYLLGYRLMADYKTVDEALHAGDSALKHRRHRVRKNTSLLNNMAPAKVRQAENIFIMTLDGDVDFRPEAVRLLLDRMKKNKKVAAVCGRIHPIGDGPMVWYQKFEYAVGHWLQKAAEHVFGCVLCCPGCFSLFRGSALIDDNVMRMYTTEAKEALHFIQYEQGEDRWLCTLLLQQGWKIDYCAGADALTFAPETFHDFYIQRRRWSPSTMANIMDLIGSWRITVKMNDNISVPFMLYQFMLMISSIVAPGLVVFLIAESYHTVLNIDLGESYVLSVVPVFLYILLCLKATTQTQINVAAAMSSVYAIIMLLVTIGTIINITSSSIVSPDVLFFISLTSIFVFAGLIHPNELFCLFHGILYFLTVPSTFVFLTVFFLCNLHVVSWGTREGPKKPEPEQEGQQQPVQEKGKLYKFFEKLGVTAIAQDVRSFVQQMAGIRDQVQTQDNPGNKRGASQSAGNPNQSKPEEPPPLKKDPPPPPKPKPEPVVVEPDPSFWVQNLDIPGSNAEELEEEETRFWNFLIDEYLHPIKANKDQQDKISADLISARNNVVFAFMLLNLMFTLVLLQLRLQRSKLEDAFYIAGKYEPVSTVSLILFTMLLLIQFCGMLSHRWGTFLHLIASTRIAWFKANEEKERALTAIQEAQKLTAAHAEGDIDLLMLDNSDNEEDDTTEDTATALSGISSLRVSSEDSNDLEDAPDYDSEEDETQFGGGGGGDGKPVVQYDTVFNKRYRTVKRRLEQQTRGFEQQHHRGILRTSLFEKNPAAAAISRPTFRTRYLGKYERRQSLYVTNPQEMWERRRSVLHV